MSSNVSVAERLRTCTPFPTASEYAPIQRILEDVSNDAIGKDIRQRRCNMLVGL